MVECRMVEWCGKCYVVSNDCDEPTSCLVQPNAVVKLCTLGVLTFGVNLIS